MFLRSSVLIKSRQCWHDLYQTFNNYSCHVSKDFKLYLDIRLQLFLWWTRSLTLFVFSVSLVVKRYPFIAQANSLSNCYEQATKNPRYIIIWFIFLFSTATIVCSRNTIRESSHIPFFCGGEPFCEVVQRPKKIHGELTGLLEWPACLSLHLRDQQISPFRLSDQRISLQRLSNQRISALSPKLQTLYCLVKSHADIWISSSPTYFSVYAWLSELTYFRFFSGKLLILSANKNICHPYP